MQRIIARFVTRVVGHALGLQARKVVDLGCGEGMVGRALTTRLPWPVDYHGVELDERAHVMAEAALPAQRIERGDLHTHPVRAGWADLALCLEVLEHLDDPAHACRAIARWSARLTLISVPHEPYFQLGNLMRGKYLRHAGNHPEHIQHFSPRSLRRLVKGAFHVVEVEPCFPWLIALAAVPRS